MRIVLSNDGNYPIEPGFDHMIYYRNVVRKELFYDSAGLVGNHGEEWYHVRSKVIQLYISNDHN